MTSFPKITEALRLTLKPGDILVLRFKHALTERDVDMIRQQLVPQLPEGVKPMILDWDADVKVVGPPVKCVNCGNEIVPHQHPECERVPAWVHLDNSHRCPGVSADLPIYQKLATP